MQRGKLRNRNGSLSRRTGRHREAFVLQRVRHVCEPSGDGRALPRRRSQRYTFVLQRLHEVRDAPDGMLENVSEEDPRRDVDVVREVDVEGDVDGGILCSQGREMEDVFDAQRRDVRRRGSGAALLWLWTRTSLDIPRAARRGSTRSGRCAPSDAQVRIAIGYQTWLHGNGARADELPSDPRRATRERGSPRDASSGVSPSSSPWSLAARFCCDPPGQVSPRLPSRALGIVFRQVRHRRHAFAWT